MSKRGRCWTKADEDRLLEMLEAHRNYAQIAKALGRSASAVINRCALLGVSAMRAGGRTVREMGHLLGVDDKAVAWWVDEGWLTAHDTGVSMWRGPVRVVEHEDLIAFLENADHWHLWEPERIADAAIREWCQEMRAGVRYYTTREAGEILCLTHYAVNSLIRGGRIRAVRHANWLIRNDWLHYDLQPWRQGERLSAEEVEFVRQWWGKYPATWIAERLGNGRSDNTVGNAARRMGLASLGRGYWRRVKAASGGD